MSSSDAMKDEFNPKERQMKDVPAPLWKYLDSNILWDNQDKPRVQELKQHLLREGRLDPKDAIKLVKKAQQQYKQEPNLLILKDPISVCGDIHGQYYDLIKLLDIGGEPGQTQYLFLGDYVDRGYFGTEVCFLLFAYKVLFPRKFFMIRGNHECRHLTAYFNFKQEVLFKYNQEVYDTIMNCFDCLPLGAVLNEGFLCVHGGLSPEIKMIEEINLIDRFREPPSKGPMCDLLWADPAEEDDESESQYQAPYVPNKLRGCSYVFNYSAASTFLKNNNLLSVIRAHEAQDEGYRLYKKGEKTGFPTVICIFSAPNYCDVYNNKGAIIRFKDNLMNIRQFNCSPHPYYLPQFMNAFNWSLPFVVEKVMDMFGVILNLCEVEEETSEEKPMIDEQRAKQIKNKIFAVGRLSRMYKTLREERESIIALKGLAGGHIPKGLILQGPGAIRQAVQSFSEAKRMDKHNERLPRFSGKVPPLQKTMSQKEIEKRLGEIGRIRAKTPPNLIPNVQISTTPSS